VTLVCDVGGVRVQANPMMLNEAARMTHGTTDERRARPRCFLRGTQRDFAPRAALHCLVHRPLNE
jgi:hypothetical protein